MRIYDSSAVFINSHFSSGSSEGDELRRNLDFSEIIRRAEFPHELQINDIYEEDKRTPKKELSYIIDGLPDLPSEESNFKIILK